MNEQEREINLKRLLYKALRHWRVAAVVAIIGAVVIGGTKCTMELIKLSDPEVVEKRQTEYLGKLAQYRQEGEAIQKSLDTMENSIQQKEEYNEKSVLMKIDPYNEWRGSIDFYIDTDYQIMPDATYQNPNLANQIVKVYSTYITNGELYQYIIDRLETPTEFPYLREILSASVDDQTFLVHFSVRNVSEESCKKLLTLIEEGMKEKQKEISKSVDKYELIVTNNSVYSQINYDLEQMQKDNLQDVTDFRNSLSVKKLEYLEWERKEGEIRNSVITSNGRAIKDSIKTAILTGIIAAFVILLFYGLAYLFSKFVQDRDEFDGWGCFVGELPRSYKKRGFRWVDRIISKLFLGDVRAGEYDTRLVAIAKQIGEAAKLSYGTAEPVIVLAGDLPKGELEDLTMSMQQSKAVYGVRFVAGGNPLLEARAIDALLLADGVILVAKQEYTKKENVYQIKEQLKELKKPLAAVVLTEADAAV